MLVGGLVTHRQRPATAGGVTFVNLEDETGMLNVTCSEGLWARYRTVALGSAALLVRGRLERSPEGVLNLVADRLQRLPLAVPVTLPGLPVTTHVAGPAWIGGAREVSDLERGGATSGSGCPSPSPYRPAPG